MHKSSGLSFTIVIFAHRNETDSTKHHALRSPVGQFGHADVGDRAPSSSRGWAALLYLPDGTGRGSGWWAWIDPWLWMWRTQLGCFIERYFFVTWWRPASLLGPVDDAFWIHLPWIGTLAPICFPRARACLFRITAWRLDSWCRGATCSSLFAGLSEYAYRLQRITREQIA